ncbi:hypothetical protein Cme02nite_54870 [Catellatospora methionotrophica]|uniref:WXG100 family type VII secretion target n=1 Tax=Catellatospora methionotrophica TaxID=121620 RepID=A0A8J3LMA5_9ACTN|nr:hypothetical protein [Catellatospora methionotrophica]GIG17155.1 hypothetical protein Cme02nite_54870 [Catellatospora methionotrophica]
MSLTGMDIQAVRHLAKMLGTKADEIEAIANSLTHQLGSVEWRGADADRFRSEWNSGHRSQLLNVASALRDTSSVATRNANEQEQAAAH